MENAEHSDNKIIKVLNLTKKFGDFLAVDGISFEVDKGEIFAFLGPNGAGKTTTIKILTTLSTQTSGDVIINGYNTKVDKDDVRHSFGIVFQDNSLDEELTAYENMEFHGILYGVSKSIRRPRIEQLLKIVELWERKNDLVKHFSGGMRRRLEIARGLIHHPKILFLDEPTLGLDPQTRNHIWDHIKKLNKDENITVFFTTHYMEEAEKISSRVAVIDHGKIISQGTVGELKAQTKTNSLEGAFLSLTGFYLRQEERSSVDAMRMRGKMFRR